MPFCTSCGSRVEDGSRFCTACGTVVEAASTAQPAPTAQVTAPAPVAAAAAPQQVAAQPATPAAKLPPVVKIIIAVVIVLVVLGMLAAGGVAYGVYKAKQKMNDVATNGLSTEDANKLGVLLGATSDAKPAVNKVDLSNRQMGATICDAQLYPYELGEQLPQPADEQNVYRFKFRTAIDTVVKFYRDKYGVMPGQEDNPEYYFEKGSTSISVNAPDGDTVVTIGCNAQ